MVRKLEVDRLLLETYEESCKRRGQDPQKEIEALLRRVLTENGVIDTDAQDRLVVRRKYAYCFDDRICRIAHAENFMGEIYIGYCFDREDDLDSFIFVRVFDEELKRFRNGEVPANSFFSNGREFYSADFNNCRDVVRLTPVESGLESMLPTKDYFYSKIGENDETKKP